MANCLDSGTTLANPYFLEGCQYEEELLSVSLEEFWDPIGLLYVLDID